MMPQAGPASDPSRTIAVTGASGVLGGRVAARLSAAGAPLRLVVRDPERAPLDSEALQRAISSVRAIAPKVEGRIKRLDTVKKTDPGCK